MREGARESQREGARGETRICYSRLLGYVTLDQRQLSVKLFCYVRVLCHSSQITSSLCLIREFFTVQLLYKKTRDRIKSGWLPVYMQIKVNQNNIKQRFSGQGARSRDLVICEEYA